MQTISIISLIIFGFFSVNFAGAQETKVNSEDSLLLNEAQDEGEATEGDDLDDVDAADTEVIYIDEFKRSEYGDKKYRIVLNAGFNTKSTISDVQLSLDQNQSESPYYRLGFVYLAKALFPGSAFARIFSWGADVVYSKSVSSRAGAYSSLRYEERNLILVPKLYAETPLPGLDPSLFVHFAFTFNFYVQHETRLVTSFYSTKLESPKYKNNLFSEFFLPGLQIGFRYKISEWSLLLQGDSFQGEGNNPWGAFALTGGAVYDF
ncbi:MAG: hypothetical protein SGJ18_00040 [Pseudomonadota bacterium]|nr:hypothetical protein [Pseudomonadota bacterium]